MARARSGRFRAQLRRGRLFAVLVTMAAPVPTQATGPAVCVEAVSQCPTWSDTHDGPAHASEHAYASATDALGKRLFVAGYQTDSASALPGLVMAYDLATGTRLWSKTKPGELAVNVVSSIQTNADGSAVYAAGDQYGSFSGPCFTDVFSLDGATGDLRWESPLPLGDGGCNGYVDSVLSTDGARLYVTTVITDSSVRFQGVAVMQGITAAFDTGTGRQVWVARTPLTGYGFENWRIAASPDGSAVYVASAARDKFNSIVQVADWTVFAYSTEDGRPLWTATYNCTRAPVQHCYSVPVAIASSGGRVYLLGNDTVTVLLAFSATEGSLIWERAFDPEHSNYVYVTNHPLVTGAHGEVYVAYYLLDLRSYALGQINLNDWFVTARVSGNDGSVVWSHETPANAPGNGISCGGCGPVLTYNAIRNRVYVAGAYPLGDSLLTAESLDAETGNVNWSSLFAWNAGGLVSEFPTSISVPAAGGAVAIVGAANNTSPTCLICFDVGSVVYPE